MEAQPSDQVRKRLGALVAEDRPEAGQLMESLRELRRDEGVRACSALLHLLAHLELPESQAERLLVDLLEHRDEITRALGRDPGLRVAAVDYLSNVKKLLTNPTIVERSQLERTERSAITDALTGLFNRRHFMNTLGLELRRSHRYSLQLSLLMLDLDGFKRLNDRLGHLVGDLVLQRVGQVVRRAVREADVACRYGGDEFAVILPETDRLGAYAVAERVRRQIERRFREKPIRGKPIEVKLSGGIAAYPEDGGDPAELVARADQALYLSKHLGKDRISVFHSERRREIRYPAKPGVRLKLARPGDEAPQPAQPVNLSRTGMLFEAGQAHPAGTPLSIRFEGRDPAGQPLSWLLAGHVVRTDAGAMPPRTAVAFDGQLPEECLFEQVQRTKMLRTAVTGSA